MGLRYLKFVGFLAVCLDYYSHIFYYGMADGGSNPTHDLWENGDEVYASTLLAVLSFYQDKICLDHLIATDLDKGLTAQLYSSRQEIRQRLSQSLAEITSMLDQTREQIETLKNDL